MRFALMTIYISGAGIIGSGIMYAIYRATKRNRD